MENAIIVTDITMKKTCTALVLVILCIVIKRNMDGMTPSQIVINFIKSVIQPFAAETPEDAKLSVTQLISKYGYPVETHNVVTDDGYKLGLFRIPPKSGRGEPVFLMHGFMGSADDFITAGPGVGLGYILADAGYDVWLGNMRGGKHSLNHTRFVSSELKYWDFCIDELALRDLPAMLDYVLMKTKRSELYYIGHSVGTLVINMLCSRKPEYNEKIKLAVLLSPIASTKYMTSTVMKLFRLLARVTHTFSTAIGDGEVLLNASRAISMILQMLCDENSRTINLCLELIYLADGEDRQQINTTNLPVFFGHYPTGCSSKQLNHLVQMHSSDRIANYDYGAHQNLNLYGRSSPPEYSIKNFTAPVMLVHGMNDQLTPPKDVERLRKSLPNVVKHYISPYAKFNHIDFLWATDVKKHVYDEVLKTMQLY